MTYQGGKFKLRKFILPILYRYIEFGKDTTYIEPFCGGCNVIFEFNAYIRIANDINPYLIAMYKALVYNNWQPPEFISKEDYIEMKNNKENYPKELVGWVGFMFSYCGMFFNGYILNIKDGIIKNNHFKNRLKGQLPKLKGIIFKNKQYYNLDIPVGSLVYCDPPYVDTTGYGYTEKINYDKFWNWVRYTSKKNTVITSGLIAPEDFECMAQKEVPNYMTKGKGIRRIEKLFKYKGEK